MAAPPSSSAYGPTVVGGLVTLGESILVALAVPFIVLGLGLPIVLLARLVLELFRALFH